MTENKHTWALVLAAGDGSRLRSLTTTTDGVAVPKQFCSLYGGPSLLQDALDRAKHVAPMSRVCCIVASQHRHWWSAALSGLPSANIIIQPENRGTAHGILLPLMVIFARDPDAQVVILPADHYLRDEATFAKSLQAAAFFRRYILQFDSSLGYRARRNGYRTGLYHSVKAQGERRIVRVEIRGEAHIGRGTCPEASGGIVECFHPRGPRTAIH
jgi:hypothetical protein